jgi:acetyl-CoA acetyltransferase
MTKPDVLIIGGARTPMTDYVGALKDVPALELGAIALGHPLGVSGTRLLLTAIVESA